MEPLEINHFSFEEQFHTFNNRRYAVDPATGVGLVGDMSAIQKYGASSVYDRTGTRFFSIALCGRKYSLSHTYIHSTQ